jgi:LysM repeat protein
MSSAVEALSKPVGPMPLGAWLVVGAGGLFLAYRSQKDGTPDVTNTVEQVPVPVGAIASPDGAPAIVNVVVYNPTPDATGAAPVGATVPDPVLIGRPPIKPGVPSEIATTTRPAKRTYLTKLGDTVWTVAPMFGLTATQLLTLNPLSPAHLTHRFLPGELLRVEL